MKRPISLALAIVMIICLSTTAFATTVTETGNYTSNVTGNYVAGNESTGTVYYVDIVWQGLDVTFHAAKEPVWDPENLTYSEGVSAFWEGSGTITVTSRSNTKISATPSYSAATGYESASMEFSTDKLKISSAEFGTVQSGTINVTPAGSLPSMDSSATIGTITLTIAQDPDVTLEEAKALSEILDSDGVTSTYYLLDTHYHDEYHAFLESQSELNTIIAIIESGESGSSSDRQSDLNSTYNSALSNYYICQKLYNQLNSSSN